MPRDTTLLSDKDLYVKTANMVEHVRNCKIKIQYAQGDNYCSYFNEKFSLRHRYLINLANPPIKGITKYTAFIHELGHILYQTPFFECSQLFKFGRGWREIKDLAHNVFNALEDQRIESHLSRNYLAYGKRFLTTRKVLGSNMKVSSSKDNPLFILLAIRFMRSSLVKDSKNFNVYKKAMEDVEKTDRLGALRVLLRLRKYLQEYEEERYKILSLPPTPDDNIIAKKDQYAREYREEKLEANWSREHQKSKPLFRKFGQIPKELQGLEELTESQLDEIVSEGKELGEREFQEVREKLTETTNKLSPLPANVVKLGRGKFNRTILDEVKIDTTLSKRLRSTFKQLQTRKKETISEDGFDVDVEHYVDNFITGVNLNNCLITDKEQTEASIIISIDASSSMAIRMSLVRNLVATLLDSVKTYKNIHVKCNVWASDYNGKIGITEIEDMKDIGRIIVEKNYFATPTHMGIDYSRRMLKEMRGSKKLVILLTDGSPNYFSNGRRVARDIYYRRCKKELQRLLAVTPNVICVGILNNANAETRMKKLFGSKHVVFVNSFDYAAEKVIKQFKQVVSNALH